MTVILLDLDDYVVTDTGDVIVRYPALINRLRKGEPIDGLCTFQREDVTRYNQRNPTRPLRIVAIDGQPGSFSERLYEWRMHQHYRELDLDEYFANRVIRFDHDSRYIDRVVIELDMMRQRGMEDFIRLLIYMADVFDREGVVHGIGRGSACASLVLYLIGTHMVDPIEYDIPIEEFLR